MRGGGDTGVGIFFIITGFFLAYNKKIRNILPLIFQMYFYGIIVSFMLSFWIALIKADGGSAGLLGDSVRFIQIVVLSPVAAISIFLLFKEIEIGIRKGINIIASATLAVYLFHEAPYNRILLWDKIFRIKENYHSQLFPLYIILVCIIVFSMGVGIELLRRKIMAKCYIF